jgi:hypothetical protein
MFGFSVAISGDGKALAVSEPFSTTKSGSIYIYRLLGGRYGSPTVYSPAGSR